MASCPFLAAPRYPILIPLHHFLKHSINKSPKRLCCRELSTYILRNWSHLPSLRNDPCIIRSRRITRTPVLPETQNNGVFNLGFNQFSSKTGKTDEPNDLLDGMTPFQKVKYILKNYWYVSIPVHIFTSLVWIGSFYYASLSGIDIVKLLECLHVPEYFVNKIKESNYAAHLVTALALYKLVTPLRYAVTIGGTSLSIKFLRQKGLIKPVPNKHELKRLYKEKKDALKEFKASFQDKVQMKKGDLMKTKEDIKQQYVEARDELQKSVIDTKREIKKGAKELSSECKHVGGLVYKSLKEISQANRKPDYVAKLVKDKK